MTQRLLDRQTRLLEYLMSGTAIFGENSDAPLDPVLQGFDRARLNLEARFSHEKRREKIAAVFPKTFVLLGNDLEAIVREFAETCPSTDISRLENARQFSNFLVLRWKSQPPPLPYLPDVTACELACAQVRAALDGSLPPAKSTSYSEPTEIRRNPGIALLHTRFDIRPIFEESRPHSDLIERRVSIAVTVHAGQPKIFELSTEIFDLLSALDDWATVEGSPAIKDLVLELEAGGLLEARR
jgi:hypothetical protein